MRINRSAESRCANADVLNEGQEQQLLAQRARFFERSGHFLD